MKNLIEIQGDVWDADMIMMIGLQEETITIQPYRDGDAAIDYDFDSEKEAQSKHLELVKAWKGAA